MRLSSSPTCRILAASHLRCTWVSRCSVPYRSSPWGCPVCWLERKAQSPARHAPAAAAPAGGGPAAEGQAPAMEPAPASQAFRNGVRLLKPKSALFIDGMSLDLREKLTSEEGLVPLDYACREIHEFARTHVGERWWNYYYGMEPYASWHRDRLRRFSTIFLKEAPLMGSEAEDVVKALRA